MLSNVVVFLFDLDESVCGRKLKCKETKSSWFEGLGVWGTCWMLFKPRWPQSREPVCCSCSHCCSRAISWRAMCWLISQKHKFDLAQEQAHDHISVKLARTHHTELSWSLRWLCTSWGRMNDFQYSLSWWCGATVPGVSWGLLDTDNPLAFLDGFERVVLYLNNEFCLTVAALLVQQ